MIDKGERSPYKLGKEKTGTVRIHKSTLRALKYISLAEDKSTMDVVEDLITVAKDSPKYKKYKKYWDMTNL